MLLCPAWSGCQRARCQLPTASFHGCWGGEGREGGPSPTAQEGCMQITTLGQLWEVTCWPWGNPCPLMKLILLCLLSMWVKRRFTVKSCEACLSWWPWTMEWVGFWNCCFWWSGNPSLEGITTAICLTKLSTQRYECEGLGCAKHGTL